MDLKDISSKISEWLSIPKWWIEFVIIEYFECRHFFLRNKPWSIDFALLSKDEIDTIPSFNVVIPACSILYHNIDQSELQTRMAKAIVGEELEPLKNNDIQVKGLANDDCFPMTFNSYDEWDPKLQFGNHCIVRDNENFYQWKIADPVEVKGSPRGKWQSDFLDLSEIDSVPNRLFELGDKIRKEEIDIVTARIQARSLYKELERIRKPIRSAIMEFHKKKLSSVSHSPKLIPGQNDLHRTKKSVEEPYGTSHSTRLTIVSKQRAYEYFSDIESYPQRYPDYCKKIEILEKSENCITTKEFWNIMIQEDIDHVVLTVKYTFLPPEEIQYEIIDGYDKAIGVRNHILIRESKDERLFVDYNNVFLDVICFPPHRIQYGHHYFRDYHDKIHYFTIKDCIHLEKKPMEPFKEGELCSKCKKGHLEKSTKKEDFSENNFRRRTDIWICDTCGQEFKHYMVDTSDEISFDRK
jgi:hypothetical protein